MVSSKVNYDFEAQPTSLTDDVHHLMLSRQMIPGANNQAAYNAAAANKSQRMRDRP